MSSTPKPTLKLDWCSHEAAKYACEKWHYSRCYPRGKSAKVGVWEGGRFVGVVIFADSPNKDVGTVYGLGYGQVTELMRVALSGHAATVTRVVAIAIRMLKLAFSSIRLVVSFADPERGHHGGIYQGGNWLYAGMTQPSDEYIVLGRRMHGKSLRQTRKTHPSGKVSAANVMEWARKVIDPNIRMVQGSSKHRYLMPLDEEMRRRIMPLAKPYPKRAASSDGAAPANHAGEGGSTPTAALS